MRLVIIYLIQKLALPSDELEKVLYIRCETADEVILDNWKPVANSCLKKTIV